jgi:hypothetical protein
MNSILKYLSKYVLGSQSSHSGNYTFLRAIMSLAYLSVITYCTLKDPATRNTVITITGGLLGTLCGTHAIGSYFGSPPTDTNPGAPD